MTDWRKSSYSNGTGGNCVEACATGLGVLRCGIPSIDTWAACTCPLVSGRCSWRLSASEGT